MGNVPGAALEKFLHSTGPTNWRGSGRPKAGLRVSRYPSDLQRGRAGLRGDRCDVGFGPTATGRRGESIGPRSPPNKGDVWMYHPPLAEDRDLGEHVEALWQVLAPHAGFLTSLKAHARVEVFLGYSSNIDHGGIVIPNHALEIFTKLGLDLNLNIVVQLDE